MVIAIAITTALAIAGTMRPMTYSALPWDFLFLTNYTGEASKIPIRCWSLDVEEHLHLLFPLAFAFVRGRGQASVGRVGGPTCLRGSACDQGRDSDVDAARAKASITGRTPASTRSSSGVYSHAGTTGHEWSDLHWRAIRFALAGPALVLTTLVIRDPVVRGNAEIYSLQGAGSS
jgi:hypothetical protein